jgi:hypothetical protein
VNKSGLGVVSKGKLICDTLRLNDGIWDSSVYVTDTIQCKSLIDSTTDSSIFRSPIVFTQDIKLSSLAKIRYSTGCKFIAAGTAQQYVYTNGKAIPAIIVRKGAKLTVKK